MQLRYLIIGPKKSPNTLDLIEEIEKRGHVVTVCSITDILFFHDGSRFAFSFNDTDLIESFDILIVRSSQKNPSLARILVQFFIKKNKFVLDSVISDRHIAGKVFQAAIFSQNNIPHPKTLTTQSLATFEAHCDQLGLPIVAKPIVGSQGKGIVLLESMDSAIDFFKDHKESYLFQEKINLESDYRIFIVNNEILGAIKRDVMRGDFRTNASLGATTSAYQPEAEMVSLAIKANQALGYDVAGVDIVKMPDGYIVFEVNNAPQWQAFKKSTGISVAEKIIDFTIKKYLSNQL